MERWIVYQCQCGNHFMEPINDSTKAFEVKDYRCNCCDFGRKDGGRMTAMVITLESRIKEVVHQHILSGGKLP